MLRVARVLAIPCSSSKSERVFSIIGGQVPKSFQFSTVKLDCSLILILIQVATAKRSRLEQNWTARHRLQRLRPSTVLKFVKLWLLQTRSNKCIVTNHIYEVCAYLVTVKCTLYMCFVTMQLNKHIGAADETVIVARNTF